MDNDTDYQHYKCFQYGILRTDYGKIGRKKNITISAEYYKKARGSKMTKPNRRDIITHFSPEMIEAVIRKGPQNMDVVHIRIMGHIIYSH